jgi:hypothetical protein
VTVFFEGLGLAIVTGSKSGIVILRSVASRNTFLRCRDIKAGTEIYLSELYQTFVQQKKQSSTFLHIYIVEGCHWLECMFFWVS